MSNEIIKEATVLRKRLQKGSINIMEMEAFLVKVENLSSPQPKRKIKIDRFALQLENLNNGHSKKIRV